MQTIIRRKFQVLDDSWAGGVTRQLFIFPASASLNQRNFSVRISTASVTTSPSTFTRFPSFHRTIMPITAPLKLSFQDSEVDVAPFEPVSFEGDWYTVSHGISTDFGVIFTDDYSVDFIPALSQTYKTCDGFTVIYATEDYVKVLADNKEHTLLEGDLIVFDSISNPDETALLTGKNTVLLDGLILHSNSKVASFTLTTPQKNAAIIARISKKPAHL